MSRRSPRRLIPVAVVLAAALCLLALPAVAAADAELPDAYLIEGVPLYQQIQAVGCGAAAGQMVLDYWGPFVDRRPSMTPRAPSAAVPCPTSPGRRSSAH